MTQESEKLICGVVEGFYGRPWTTDQRKDLFRRLEKLGMNSYVYAPKDDLKHRAFWRDLYTVEEADHLQSLIEAAKQRKVCFYYALSPGLDICYSNQKEVNAIKQKLEQVRCLGCEWFALLFDDIEPVMSDVDKLKFTSFAEAQVNVTNEVYDHLNQPKFLFCPTEYCESRALPSLENSDYLNCIGKKLAPGIDILWTGPRVISRTISVSHLSTVRKVLRRKPVIWDNLHANDYDNKRVFLGPYAGRSALVKLHIAGIVTNPNCEFEANFVAMHTLAHWNVCTSDADIPKDEDATLEAGSLENVAVETTKHVEKSYHPLKALNSALDDWLPEISAHRNAFVKCSTNSQTHSSNVPVVNTCAGITSTTSSNSSFGGDLSVVYTTMANSLPLYTPPAIAESVTNPFCPPPLLDSLSSSTTVVEETSNEVHTPVLTAAMQAVNSLTDEYSEPMELALPPTSNSNSASELDVSSPSTKKKLKTMEECVEACNTIVRAAVVEMMENKNNSNCEHFDSSATTSATESGETSLSGEMPMMTEECSTSSGTACADERKEEEEEVNNQQNLMQIDKDEGVEEMEAPTSALNRADLQLLCELFYLPFEHGARANFLIQEFVWLKSNASVVRQGKELHMDNVAAEWMRRSADFDELTKTITDLCVRLVECPNRGLVYDFYPYVFDLQGILNCLNSYLKWIECGYYGCNSLKPNSFINGLNESTSYPAATKISTAAEGEPWMVRRALSTELQRLLPLETSPDLFICRPPHPPCSRIFRVRPYMESDRKIVYDICRSTIADGNRFLLQNHAELIGDRFVGGFLDLRREYCLVVEDTSGIVVGFALAALNAVEFYDDCQKMYFPRMQTKHNRDSVPFCFNNAPQSSSNSDSLDDDSQFLTVKSLIDTFYNVDQTLPQSLSSRYPSVVFIRVLPYVLDTSAPKRLLVTLFSALKSNGSPGVFGEVFKKDRVAQDTYLRWNFFEVTMLDDDADELCYYGRVL